MAQEATSWDPVSIPGRNTSFDVPESSCLLSGPWLHLELRYNGQATSVFDRFKDADLVDQTIFSTAGAFSIAQLKTKVSRERTKQRSNGRSSTEAAFLEKWKDEGCSGQLSSVQGWKKVIFIFLGFPGSNHLKLSPILVNVHWNVLTKFEDADTCFSIISSNISGAEKSWFSRESALVSTSCF